MRKAGPREWPLSPGLINREGEAISAASKQQPGNNRPHRIILACGHSLSCEVPTCRTTTHLRYFGAGATHLSALCLMNPVEKKNGRVFLQVLYPYSGVWWFPRLPLDCPDCRSRDARLTVPSSRPRLERTVEYSEQVLSTPT